MKTKFIHYHQETRLRKRAIEAYNLTMNGPSQGTLVDIRVGERQDTSPRSEKKPAPFPELQIVSMDRTSYGAMPVNSISASPTYYNHIPRYQVIVRKEKKDNDDPAKSDKNPN